MRNAFLPDTKKSMARKEFFMRKISTFLLYTALAVILCIYGFFGVFAWQTANIPENLRIEPGSSKELILPAGVEVSSSGDSILNIEGAYPLSLKANEEGISRLSLKLFGVELKKVSVTVGEGKILIPGGQCIGVMLYTKGALVVGASDIRTAEGKVNPAKNAGLLSGDVIEKVNGEEVLDADHLTALISEAKGETIRLQLRRNGRLLEISIEPAVDLSDNKAKLGLWVRDSTAGVGTLTFYDPETKLIGGLGHAISDADTGQLLSVRNGEVIFSRVIEIIHGSAGEPGEIRGTFDPEEDVIGRIRENTSVGLFAEAIKEPQNPLYANGLPMGRREELHTGTASILCTLDDGGVREYSCRIIRIHDRSGTKNFTIKVTDDALLAKTGGIVQGMSGSPIIQDGKLVVAVTHVLVNDPTKGYGIFIENMLDAAS